MPTVLGLVVSVLGALGVIELRPQVEVTPLDALAAKQPFTAPFEITNTGYLGLHIDHVTVVFHKIQYSGVTFTDANANDTDWDGFDLNESQGKTKTIFANFANGWPSAADLIIAVDYRFLGKRSRRLYRFVGDYIDNWHWSKQPVGDLAPSINEVVDTSLKQHARALRKDKNQQN